MFRLLSGFPLDMQESAQHNLFPHQKLDLTPIKSSSPLPPASLISKYREKCQGGSSSHKLSRTLSFTRD